MARKGQIPDSQRIAWHMLRTCGNLPCTFLFLDIVALARLTAIFISWQILRGKSEYRLKTFEYFLCVQPRKF